MGHLQTELQVRAVVRYVEVGSMASKYKQKKKTDEGNTVYLYSDRQIALRNKKKAERIEKLRSSIAGLRTQVKKDLTAKDRKKRLTALAVGLIDHTYERVGNDDSAEEGHYGVTGWQANHVTLSAKGATIRYVGKSGVKHEKKVTDPKLLQALRSAVKDVEEKDGGIFTGTDTTVGAKDVNEYLKEFDVTAKDLRGLHANEEVLERLQKIRKDGPKLPKDRKDRDKILKKEFAEAVEGAAEAVGHEPSTLRSQYLAPGVEEHYLHDGTVVKKLTDRKASFPMVPAGTDQTIRDVVDRVAGPEFPLTQTDCLQIRVAYRFAGGSWDGALPSNWDLLEGLVVSWGSHA